MVSSWTPMTVQNRGYADPYDLARYRSFERLLSLSASLRPTRKVVAGVCRDLGRQRNS